MRKVEHTILTDKYTSVYSERQFENNAPNYYEVVRVPEYDASAILKVKFQNGPIKESGINGVMNEDLIHMVLDRLEHFQKSEFKCKENEHAITHLETALLWLRSRTMGREKRGVEGTYDL